MKSMIVFVIPLAVLVMFLSLPTATTPPCPVQAVQAKIHAVINADGGLDMSSVCPEGMKAHLPQAVSKKYESSERTTADAINLYSDVTCVEAK